MAVWQAALVSDESALEACLRRCAIQIDDLYLYLYLSFTVPVRERHCSLIVTKIYCLVNRSTCLNNLPMVVTWQCSGFDLNMAAVS